MSFNPRIASVLLLFGLAMEPDAFAQTLTYGFGHRPTDAEIAAWDIDVRADGKGLPAGRGTVARGKEVFAARCAACHGPEGKGNQAEALVGGFGTLTKPEPMRTIGSYWPWAPTVFDFIRRAMPFDQPQSLSADEVYSVTAYLLHLNGIVGANAAIDATSLPRIAMPNRDGFTNDPRPDIVVKKTSP